MTRIRSWIAVMLVLFFISGCSPFGVEGNDAPKGSILFQDEFSDSKGGWDTWNDPNGSLVSYAGGGLRILVNLPNHDYWSTVTRQFNDVRIEADAIKLGGPDDNSFGLICRYQNRENFYAFLVSSDGYAGILKVKNGSYQLIHASQMQFSPVINRGSASNRLRADCIGQDQFLFVNGQKIAQSNDADFKDGKVGLIAGSNSAPVVDFLFDRFVVIRP